jgi:hypothetical protein
VVRRFSAGSKRVLKGLKGFSLLKGSKTFGKRRSGSRIWRREARANLPLPIGPRPVEWSCRIGR